MKKTKFSKSLIKKRKSLSKYRRRSQATFKNRLPLSSHSNIIPEEKTTKELLANDESLLERSRTHWKIGDWKSLTQLSVDNLQNHYERAELALIVAAAHLQVGDMSKARSFIRLAQDWGCSKKLLSQILIAGVYNTLGKAAAIAGNEQRALAHFENGVRIVRPGGDVRLLTQARVGRQMEALQGKCLSVDNTEAITKGCEYSPSMLRQKASKKVFEKYTNFSSGQYWEKRYREGGTSGYGSYGRLAEFKAQIINKFIEDEEIERIIEFGCGDGNQLSLIRIKNYVGVDVSPTIIKKCKINFKGNPHKSFYTNDEFRALSLKADLALSLDVIFHLIEDDIFESYMNMLFNASERFCIIYASNTKNKFDPAIHVRHRRFTDWVTENIKNWRLSQVIYNKYPHDGSVNPKDFSFSDFYFYERN
jgi:SAM-dependent methyltransferase